MYVGENVGMLKKITIHILGLLKITAVLEKYLENYATDFGLANICDICKHSI